jgi:endogenous inhibitor of DNA gyrase (YacG/DUF329 family)
MSEEPEGFRCRTCRKPVKAGAKDFPFCCERCRLLDLGAWIDGRYRISRPLSPQEKANTVTAGDEEDDVSSTEEDLDGQE